VAAAIPTRRLLECGSGVSVLLKQRVAPVSYFAPKKAAGIVALTCRYVGAPCA
jgi:hypothetical protein